MLLGVCCCCWLAAAALASPDGTGAPGCRAWYAEEAPPVPPVAVAASRTLPGGACGRQLRRYARELSNGTLWAVQMYDASAKQPYGIIDGQTRHLGSFDQCYRLDVAPSSAEDEELQGRYCLVDYKFEQRTTRRPAAAATASDAGGKLDLDFDPRDSVWEAIREKGDFRRIRRYALQMALCVPASCGPSDVAEALRGPYQDYAASHDLLIDVGVDDDNCQAYREEKPFGTAGYVFCILVFAVFALVVLASLYDGTLATEDERRGTSRGRQLLLCFSAQRNLKTIFEVSYKHRGLDTIHVIKVFFTGLALVAHRSVQYFNNPVVNERYFEKTFYDPWFLVVHNGTITIDAFFAIGGLLTCYGLLDIYDKTKRMNFTGLTLIRLLRLTPAYALLIFFMAHVFPHMGSGPQWKWKVGVESENCAATWWSNLLYLNNYLTLDRMCIVQSWYMSVDFHCYLVGTFLVYGFWKTPRKVGYSILATAISISVIVPFYVTYTRRLQPIFIAFPYLRDVAKDPYFVDYHLKTHFRMTGYFVGLTSGAVLHDYKRASWKISKWMSQGLFVLAVALGLYSHSLGLKYHDPLLKASALETALYASLHRGTFAFSICSIVLLVTMGRGLDGHYKVLTPAWAQPLSRLSYTIYLFHNLVQTYHVGTARTAKTFSLHNVAWDFVPDAVCSYSVALLIAVGVEGPFRKLEKLHYCSGSIEDELQESGAASGSCSRLDELQARPIKVD